VCDKLSHSTRRKSSEFRAYKHVGFYDSFIQCLAAASTVSYVSSMALSHSIKGIAFVTFLGPPYITLSAARKKTKLFFLVKGIAPRERGRKGVRLVIGPVLALIPNL
jgi:hypothetical protein